jgi:hypothetical protein
MARSSVFQCLKFHALRAEAKLADFPKGWGKPEVVIQGDIFEASATYKLKGTGKFLTLVKAHRSGPPGTGWRYYKAYLGERLEGPWAGVADTWDKPFAEPGNIAFSSGAKWTDSVSHGELLRAGIDQRLEVDPANLRFLFQGVLDQDRAGKPYGQIPWKLGLLEPARASAPLPSPLYSGERVSVRVVCASCLGLLDSSPSLTAPPPRASPRSTTGCRSSPARSPSGEAAATPARDGGRHEARPAEAALPRAWPRDFPRRRS